MFAVILKDETCKASSETQGKSVAPFLLTRLRPWQPHIFPRIRMEEALNNPGARFKKDAASVSIVMVSGGRKDD